MKVFYRQKGGSKEVIIAKGGLVVASSLSFRESDWQGTGRQLPSSC